jgi:hypothetical protein
LPAGASSITYKKEGVRKSIVTMLTRRWVEKNNHQEVVVARREGSNRYQNPSAIAAVPPQRKAAGEAMRLMVKQTAIKGRRR